MLKILRHLAMCSCYDYVVLVCCSCGVPDGVVDGRAAVATSDNMPSSQRWDAVEELATATQVRMYGCSCRHYRDSRYSVPWSLDRFPKVVTPATFPNSVDSYIGGDFSCR